MKSVVCIILSLTVSINCLAHSRWLVPSHTVISGDNAAFVSLDLSISNDIFHPDNAYGGTALELLGKLEKPDKKSAKKKVHPLAKIAASTRMQVLKPGKNEHEELPLVNLGRKSSSALRLEEEGTYKFLVSQDPIFYTSYMGQSGKPGRIFGVDKRSLKSLPDNASKVLKTKLMNRVLSYVTRNGPTEISTADRGLDIKFFGHPNDLFTDEKAVASLMFNGKVLANTEVKIIRGNTRYRNNRELQTLVSDSEGRLEIGWKQAGMYLIEVEHTVVAEEKGLDKFSHGLYLTLEVLPN